MSDLNENDNVNTGAENPGQQPPEASAPAAGEQQTSGEEYHYVRPESTRLYADAEYVRQDDATMPPRYYVPPEKTQVKQRKPRAKGSGLWWKVACLCLVCALLGGIAGGALAGTSLAKKLSASTGTASTATASGSGTSTVAASKTGTMTPAQIYDMACKQVVGIQSSVTYSNFFGQTTTAAVSGTGFFISTDGYILTNYHVIEDAYQSSSKITVLTHDGTSYTATVTGVDSSNDLAVLKIDATNTNAVTMGDSASMSVGDTVYAVGNPMGELQFTMTSGMVSALDRAVTTSEYTSAINMFQIDAAINEGNSGGPVYNANGQVIGIVTAKYSSSSTSSSTSVEGLGFAIPINDAKTIANDLMTKGYVTGKAYMGVSLDENYSSVYSQYYNLPEGAYVKYVESGSAAAKAGIAAGDIITKVDSKSISSYSDLTSAVKQYHSGDTATITLYRSGKTMTVTITFDEAKATSSSSSGSTAQSGSGSTQSGGSSSGSSGFGSGSNGSISLPQQGSSNSGSYYNFG
jgi:serine protease Do